jgi:uncharacterized protein (DUF1778 family)
MTKTEDQGTAPPFCIRFRVEDLKLVRSAAEREGELATVWTREAGLARAAALTSDQRVRKIDFEAPSKGTLGEGLSIRLRKDDLEVLRKAASQEKCVLGTWLRAIAIDRARRVLGKAA